MKRLVWLFALVISASWAHAQPSSTLVSLSGAAQGERFNNVLQLSDGSILVTGSAPDLVWVPLSVPLVEIKGGANLNASGSTTIGFLMHLSSDMQTIRRVLYMPQGTVLDITRIRTTNVPGQPSGELYISGQRTTPIGSEDGYFIARLNNNFVNGAPDSITMLINVVCPMRSATTASGVKSIQPWDVASDGSVVVGSGLEYSNTMVDIRIYNRDGSPRVVPNFPWHQNINNREWVGTANNYPQDSAALRYSAILLRSSRLGSLRSYTQQQYDSLMPDENNNPGRKGLFPDDYYFSGPCLLNRTFCAPGRGYTGYRLGPNQTNRLGGIAVDRRTGDFYYGYSVQTVLPDGLPDFEPCVVAINANGTMKWWARLYRESTANSAPDQYVDQMDIDYANDRVVVGARCHGNNTVNLWSGRNLANNPGHTGFQQGFTGSNGNIHISWIGKYGLNDGKIYNATFVAEPVERVQVAGVSNNSEYKPWPNINNGNMDVNTTRFKQMIVGVNGSIAMVGQGRRSFTTNTAYQQMPPPQSTAKGTWNHFCRMYSPQLDSVYYSTLVTGQWDTATGSGGDNVVLTGVWPTNQGVFAAGYFTGSGNPVKQLNTPAWADTNQTGAKALLAYFPVPRNKIPTSIRTQLSGPAFSLAPNPANSSVTLRLSEEINVAQAKIIVVSVTGQVNCVLTQAAGVYSLDTDNLPNGLYTVKVLQGLQVWQQRVAIQH